MINQKYIELFRVKPGKKIRLKDYDTGWEQTEEFTGNGQGPIKETHECYPGRKSGGFDCDPAIAVRG